MVRMRLQRKGRKKAPFYHIVIADARSPRDGRFIERIGFYNPMTSPATIEINRESALEWIAKGAQPTDTVRSILRFKGVLLRKHLLLGVKKGAISLDQADEKWKVWADAKENKLAVRREAVAKKKVEFAQAIFGTPRPRKEKPAADAEVAE